ncbi:MAG: hypothetical protein Kow0047_16290 [Anaerolineae bacterium]
MECGRCGTEVHGRVWLCPNCGARIRPKPRRVRCRYCGRQASAELTVCPSCGRTLRPAGPSLTLWAGTAAVVLLMVVGLILWPRGDGVTARVLSWAPDGEEIASVLAAALPTMQSAQDLAEVSTGAGGDEGGSTLEEIAPPETPEMPVITPTPQPTPTATSAVTETVTPTVAATPTPTVTPPSTPTSTPTASPERVTYVVQPGDTLTAISRRFGVSIEAIAQANDIEDPTALRVGQELVIPSASDVVALPTLASTGQNVYLVAPGDTPASIARKFGVSVEELMRVNNIEDSTRLQVNQRLIIPQPVSGQVTDTPTPVPPTPTPTPTPTVALIYPAPRLVSPADGTPFSGGDESFIELKWEPVGALQPGEVYVIHLGYLVGQNEIRWFYEDTVQGTSWRVPGVFQPYAPQEFGRSFRWYVQVEQIRRDADGRIIGRAPRSQPSQIWGFTWH